MKKVLFPILILVLAVSLALPVTIPPAAAADPQGSCVSYCVFGDQGVNIGPDSKVLDGSAGSNSYVTFGGSTLVEGSVEGDGPYNGGTNVTVDHITINKDVTLGGGTNVAVDVNSGGFLHTGTNVTVGGNATAFGEVTFGGGSNISGNVDSGDFFQTGTNVDVDGNITAVGDVSLAGGNHVLPSGNIDSGGDVSLGVNNQVGGNITAFGTISKPPSATVGGIETPNSGIIPTPAFPAVYTPVTLPPATIFSSGGADVIKGGSQTTTLSPSSYGTLQLGTNNILNLSAGDYYFDSFNMGGGSNLNLDLSGGPIRIFVTGNMTFGSNLQTTVTSGGTEGIHVETHGNFTLGGSGEWFGFVFAPMGNITANPNAHLTGAFWASGVVTTGNHVVFNCIECAADEGSITIVKEVEGEAPDTEWQFTGTGTLGSFTLAAVGGQTPFNDLTPGQYIITETTKPGYSTLVNCNTGETGTDSVTLTLDPGENVIVTFINTKLGSVSGYKWADCNENAEWDQDEVGLIGWEIKLYEKQNGNWSYLKSTITGPDGAYEFTDLIPGEYKVEEVLQSGWVQTHPTTTHTFTLQAGETKSNINFGNHSNGGSICANEVMAFYQGTKKNNGTITDPDRTDPDQALGPPDSINKKLPSFVSLGYGGDLVLGFAHPVSGSITVYETTWENKPDNCYGPETVDVYGTDAYQGISTTWTYIGQASNNCGYNGNTHPTTLTLTTPIRYVRLIDTTAKTTNSDDAFDVDAVCGQYACGCTVSGHKYQCHAETLECTQTGLEGLTITLEDAQGATQTVTTGSDGSYQFTGISEGSYTISEILQDGWVNCTPTSYQLTLDDNCQIHGQGVIVSDTDTLVTQGNGAIPHNAILAWKHGTWWSSLTNYNFGYPSNAAQWIWESYRVANPVDGDVVHFQRSFNIPGTPTGGTLYITCDNGYEVWINGNGTAAPGGMSAQLGADWEASNLTQNYVNTSGWQSVENYDVSSFLQQGTNTLVIKTANEYMGDLDGQEDGTIDSNPAGLIYELPYEFDATEIDFCNREAIPDISIIKTADPTSTLSGGQVTYTYQVTNTGDVNLTNINVTDDNGTPGIPGDDFTPTFVGGDDGDGILNPGETWTYEATANPTEEVTNTGKACGTDPTQQQVCDEDNATVEILEPQGSISGHKYSCDDTGSCTQDGLGDWTINLTGTVSDTTTTADTTGYYEFTGLPDGTYTVSEEIRPGWETCTPTSYEITLKDGNGYGEVVSDTTTEYWDWGADSTWGTADDGWIPAVACYIHPNWPLSPSGATWIWRTNQVAPATEYDTLPPEGYRTFRKTFEIPHFTTITSASIEINADNAYEVAINGVPVGSDGNLSKDGPVEDGWKNVETFNCTGELSPGTNTIEIHAVNYLNTGDYKTNPAGVIYKLSYQYETNQVNFCNRQLIPDISITKTADKSCALAGDAITYTITITNTGNVNLVKDNVTDTLEGDISYLFSDALAQGASDSVSYTYTVQDGDPDPLGNTVTAHYHVDGLPNDVSASASASVCLGTGYQPDNVIQTYGNNTYNTSGSGQTATQSVPNGTTATYLITIQNDGTAMDNFTVLGTAGGAGWTVNYFDATAGGNNITTEVITNTTWITPNLGPGGSIQIRVEVTPSGLPNGSTKQILVTSTSNSCICKQDTIKAITTAISGGGRGGGGGGGGNVTVASSSCPLTLTGDMLGTVAETTMTTDGVLCGTLLCTTDGNTLRIEKGTKLMLAGNIVPRLIKFSLASVTPPTPDNVTIVGPAYELLAYASIYGGTPSPITISPASLLTINYGANGLPNNASEVFIAYYDTEKGWQAIEGIGGPAEVGKARGQLSHFTTFAVLAKAAEPPAKFAASNLTVSPSQPQLNQEVNISLNVANTGGKSGSYSLELKVNGISKSTKQVTVAAGTSQTVNFTIIGDAVGKHQIEVAGLSGEYEIAQRSQINWWLIGGITGAIILLIIILLVIRRRQLRGY